jgi:hypothetical protein
MVKKFDEQGNEGVERAGILSVPVDVYFLRVVKHIDWKRFTFILLGLALFTIVYLSPQWADAVDPSGRHFDQGHEGRVH